MRLAFRACAVCFTLGVVSSLMLLFMQIIWRHLAIRGQDRHSVAEIRMPTTGVLKILQISDTQICVTQDPCRDLTPSQKMWPCNGRNTTAFIQRLLAEERPDLVIYTGDNVYGSKGEAQSRRVLAEVLEPVKAANISFALVLGNHDVETWSMSVSGMHDFVREMGALVSGNGVIHVTESSATRAHIHLFDYMHEFCVFCSDGSHVKRGRGGPYNPVTEKQIRKFEQVANANVTSVAFAHLPLLEFQHGDGHRVGSKHEGVFYGQTTRLHGALRAKKVRVFSVGHDHINDYCTNQSGVRLCYAGGSGYTTYGRPGWPRRARVFILSGKHVQTYKRLDDAGMSVIDRQEF